MLSAVITMVTVREQPAAANEFRNQSVTHRYPVHLVRRDFVVLMLELSEIEAAARRWTSGLL
jgi:hypothetical protein